jgi:hypothetical protein
MLCVELSVTSTVSKMFKIGPFTVVDFGRDCTARRDSVELREATHTSEKLRTAGSLSLCH